MSDQTKSGTFDSISSALRQIQPLLKNISQSSSLEELALAIYDILKKDFDFESTGFYFINPTNQKLELLLAQNLTEEEKSYAEMTAMQRHPGWVIKNKKTYLSHNEETQDATNFQKRLHLVSRLYAPVIFRNECIGTIGVASNKINAFNDNHVAFIEFLCQITAVAYENIIHLQELNRSRERMNHAIDSLQFGIWDWDLERDVIVWDDFMYSLYEIGGERGGRDRNAFSESLIPEDAKRIREELEECFINKRELFKSEFKINTPSGKMKRISASAKCIYRPDGRIVRVVGANWDVTELRENEVKLITASKMSSLGEMASGMAHEINNPLAIISGNALRMKLELDAPVFDKDMILKNIKTIDQTVDRIAKIIKSLRAYSRDSANDPFEVKSLELIFGETLTFFEHRLKSEQVAVKIAPLPLSLNIECRPSQIQQVLLNLIKNSFDAVLAFKEKWIEIGVEEKDHFIVIQIKDSGQGIPKEIRSKILQPFFTTKPAGKGAGLGLSISNSIVISHQGKIELDESSPNTCFKITLPKKQNLKALAG